MDFRIPFSGRAHQYTDKEIEIVSEVMKKAIPLTQGKYLHEFEKNFLEYTGAEHAFAVNNATAALELSAQLCCFEEGDEVIIPSHTFTATAYPFLKKGAKIVWADIELDTRVVSARTIKQCMTQNTKAIVVAHLYGYAADMKGIMAMARERDLLVIEDTAQALGVKVDGQMAGTFGDFGVFSFHSHKNITTLGEGGMLTLNDESLAALIPMLRHNGHCDFEFKRDDYWIPAMGNLDLPQLDGKKLFPGNYCIGEVECALGSALLQRIDSINCDKRSRAMYFIDSLSDIPELVFHRVNSTRHNYHLLVAKLTNGLRDKFIRKLADKYGIQCVVQYMPLNRYPFYQKNGYGDADCQNADNFFDNMISFPFHHMLSDADIDEIIFAVKQVAGEIFN